MPEPVFSRSLTAAEYLEGEKAAAERHEFVNGVVIAMTGASKTHNRLTKQLARLFDDRLAGGSCEAFGTDVKVRVQGLTTTASITRTFTWSARPSRPMSITPSAPS
jgi:Uma2 family endonuclease